MLRLPQQHGTDPRERSADSFLEDLRFFHASAGQRIAVLNPKLNGQPLHLAVLYQNVVNRGGWQKVNQQDAWADIAYSIGVPKPCANSGHVLKTVYHQYLLRYECSKFNRTMAEESTEDDDIFKRSTFGTAGYTKVPDYLRISYGLSTDIQEEDNFERLTLSLSSGLPNETDFAINILLVRSADAHRPFLLSDGHVILLDALMATVGLFSNHCGHYIGIYNSFRKESKKDFIRFWRETVTDPELLELLRAEGDVQPDTDITDSAIFFCGIQPPLDSTELRIKQMATIIYNLANEETNATFLASHKSCLKFVCLCARSSKKPVSELGLDLLTALASKIDISAGEPWVLPVLIRLTRSCIDNPDRIAVVQGLSLIAKICDMDKSGLMVIDSLEDADYQRMSQYLTIPDTSLIINSLEALYKLSGLGERYSTCIAEVPDAIVILVRLLTVAVETVTVMVMNDGGSTSQLNSVPSSAPPVTSVSQASVISCEEADAVVGWLTKTYEVEDAFAMTMTDVFREYVLFCASGRKHTATPQSLMHCLRIAFPQGRTTNLNIGGKVQLCLLGFKKRGDTLATILPGHVTSESQDQNQIGRHPVSSVHSISASSHPSPVLHSLISSTDPSSNKLHVSNGCGSVETKNSKGIENSSLIRSLLATKINRKNSTSLGDFRGSIGTNGNGLDEDSNATGSSRPESLISDSESRDGAGSSHNSVFSGAATPVTKKNRRKKSEKPRDMLPDHVQVNGIANGGSHLFSDDSQSTVGTHLPVPYVVDAAVQDKPKKPRGRPRVNGIIRLPVPSLENGNGDGSVLPESVKAPAKSRRSSRKPKAKAGMETEVNGHVNGEACPESPAEPVKKRRRSSKKKASVETDDVFVASTPVTHVVPASAPLSGHASPTSFSDVLDFLCEWEGCNRSFSEAGAVFKHSCIDHVPTAAEGVCRWPNCNGIKRQPLSLITHLNESHCSPAELHRQSLRRRDIKRGICSSIPPSAAQPLPNYSEHAALHSIQARYGSAVASDFTAEPETQSTKTTRLTAALILRNIAHFSHVGRIKLERHEYCLTTCAMQLSEAAGVINECLLYISTARKGEGHTG